MLDLNTLNYLHRLSVYDGDPYEDFKQQLLAQGFSEMDACHETANFMNTICNLMD
ncbi:hypothetical protein [Paenibacillus pinihumi]|uniref:hypothetical protein n=1 Tax=Paenibacillus pinihumi TaxID=669462 RepID=UPI0004257A38|nr:hypothetical protein [Paenibacillus pinihumi]